MKTIKNTGITLMLTLVASMAARAQYPSLKLAEDEQIVPNQTYVQPFDNSRYRAQQSVRLQLNVAQKACERVSVRLLTEDGALLYPAWVWLSMQKYAGPFDFTKIKDGTYTIEVINGGEVTRKTIILSTPEAVPAPARNLVELN